MFLAYLACALIWGTTWFAIRRCIGDGGFPTFTACALRFSIAGTILLAVCAAGRARPGPLTWRQWLWTLLAGALNAVGYGLVYAGEEKITGGLACVIYGTAPLIMALFAIATRTERPTQGGVVGSLISLAGIAIIFADRLALSTAQAAGVVMVLGSLVTSTAYTVVLKRHATSQHPLATNTIFLVTTSVLMWLVVAVAEDRPVPWPLPLFPTIALLYLSVVGSVIVFAAYLYLMKRVRLMTLATLGVVEPVIALSVDAAWEQEPIGARTYVGAAAVLAGVAVTILIRKSPTTSQA